MKHSAYALKLATAAALAGTSQAYGQIIPLVLPGNITGQPNSDPAETYTLPGSTGGPDFRFEVYNGSGGYFFTGATPLKATDAIATNYPNGFYASAVAAGAKIGSDTTYSFTTGPSTINVLTQQFAPGVVTSYQQPNTDTYLGFQFTGADGQLHDGYLELDSVPYTDDSNAGGLFFIGGAYNALPDNSPDGAGDIFAGEVPEPGTLSFLVLGAAALGGVGLLRRRRAGLVLARD